MAFVRVVLHELGALVLALFGWSVTAIFGSAPRARRLVLSAAMALSVMWALSVIGLLVDGLALRISSLAFVAGIPFGVRALLAPHSKLWMGYRMTVALFASFCVAALTAPFRRFPAATRGLTDDHVLLEPRPERTAQVMHDLCEACSLAGITPSIASAPQSMALASKTMHALSSIGSIPKLVRGDGIELYVYESALLIRGEPHRSARVRAMMTETPLERDAWLVESDRAREIQEELARMWQILVRHAAPDEIARPARAKLGAIRNEMTNAPIDFADWVTLDRIARRIEHKLGAGERIEPRPTSDLLRSAMQEARKLVRLEVEIAKGEAKVEAGAASRAATGFGIAAAFGIVAIAMIGDALLFAFGGGPTTALIISAASFGLAAISIGIGYLLFPKQPLERTRRGIERAVKSIERRAQ